MRVRISREELQQRSLFIAVPQNQTPAGLLDTVTMLQAEGLASQYRQYQGENAAEARNLCVDEFMRSRCTHLLLWDADIVASPNDALMLLSLASLDSPYDVVCGACPQPHISWAKVRDAVRQGWADEDPSILADFVADFTFKPLYPTVAHNLDEPVEVEYVGAGFMLIQRHVINRLRRDCRDMSYYDGSGNWHEVSCFFVPELCAKSFLDESANFCRLVRASGMQVWLVPRINLALRAGYAYRGNITAQAQLRKPMAADKDSDDTEAA